jgi:hypothetical protein
MSASKQQAKWADHGLRSVSSKKCLSSRCKSGVWRVFAPGSRGTTIAVQVNGKVVQPFERDRPVAGKVTFMVTVTDKPIVKIENWSVVGSVIFEGYQELEPGQRLLGDVFTHRNLSSGLIYTSAILSVDHVNGLVETRNTIYRLGAVSGDYARWASRQKNPRAA